MYVCVFMYKTYESQVKKPGTVGRTKQTGNHTLDLAAKKLIG